MSQQEPWASVEDVAKHLGNARAAAYCWTESKGLPAHEMGRLWSAKPSDLDEWMRAGGPTDQEQAR